MGGALVAPRPASIEYATLSNRRAFHKQGEEKIDIQGDCLTSACMYEEVVKRERKRQGGERDMREGEKRYTYFKAEG